ncbi:hypothetical protein ICK_06121 [Bacillus cereus BAG1X2-2]|nr:hypothetical protein ICK_06121 [Bacillus cereus BAG1X2-2]
MGDKAISPEGPSVGVAHLGLHYRPLLPLGVTPIGAGT